MESFFERVAHIWPAGRRDLHWHILPTPSEARELAAYSDAFIRPGLQGVPVQGMHCTLLHAVGLAATDVDLDGLLADVTNYAQTVDPFALTFDRPAVGSVAVEVSGWPGAPFAKIVENLTHAMTRTDVPFTPAPSRYPHMSLAYTSCGAEAIEAVTLKTALAAIASPLSGTVHVDRIHLVEQWHDGKHIAWESIAEILLAGVTA
ncbi:2'-5' RNA ligase family protein [Streptomyces sp. NPDC056500]|uniref:2'-5' RNA ligase family protein n=1 Tax=Streptomyces sp. NPDC056500 TaxID=3345840 RepID=UPI0036AFF3ED